MPFPQSLQKRPPSARQDFYTLFVLMLIALIIGPVLVFTGVHIDRRDRVSLQWPKITCKMLHWHKTYHSGGVHGGGSDSFAATYTYVVNRRRYVGSQVSVWQVDLDIGSADFADFAVAHPVDSPVDVYYDPQNPGNAVLIPGPYKTFVRLFIIGGSLLCANAVVVVFLLPSRFARMRREKMSYKLEKQVS